MPVPGPGHGYPPDPGQSGDDPSSTKSHRLLVGLLIVAVVCVLAGAGFVVLNNRNHRTKSHNAASTSLATSATGAAQPAAATSTSVSSASTTTTPGAKAPRSPTAQAVASQINGLLTKSEQDRTAVNAAATLVSSCTNLSSAAATFAQSVTVRKKLLTQLHGIDTSVLPNGPKIRADLVRVFDASIADDQALAQWTSAKMTGGCGQSPPSDTSSLNDAASAAKNAFVGVWNPVATQFGFPNVAGSSI